MWEHCLERIADDPLTLGRECDWVTKHNLIEGLPGAPRRAAQPPQGLPDGPAVPRRRPPARPSSTGCRSETWSSGCAPTPRSTRPSTSRPRPPGLACGASSSAGPSSASATTPSTGSTLKLKRPGPAHGAVQGPVPRPRRAGREAHRLALMGDAPSSPDYDTDPGRRQAWNRPAGRARGEWRPSWADGCSTSPRAKGGWATSSVLTWAGSAWDDSPAQIEQCSRRPVVRADMRALPFRSRCLRRRHAPVVPLPPG